jgi:hypothetical protein
MGKIFVSMPMHGMSVEALSKRMAEVEKKIKKDLGDEDDELTIVNSLDTRPPIFSPRINPRLYYLGHAIAKMAECDCVYFDTDWETAKGCQIEFEVAIRYGLTCYFAS